MGIFDTHAHYSDEAFDNDRYELLSKMNDEGVDNIVEIGDCIERSKKAIEIAKDFDFIHAACGIHPECVDDVTEDDFIILEDMIKNKNENKIVAIGEIGLDYYYTKDNKEKQIEVFKRQLDLAIKYDMSVVIHTRDASQDTFEIVKEYCSKGLRGIVHCFSESVELAKEYEKLGMYIGIGGVLTFKNGRKLAEVVNELDMKNFVLETDSPYLSPEPHRGERNDSRNIKFVVDKICEIKNISKEEVLEITTNNAKKIYNL
ncbi:MAG: TatD family hydrolase [Clostridia bacterium]|nr:TatD family hydrolase [Clostridia bacterium]